MRSAAAIAGPGVMPIRPAGSAGQLCSANTRSAGKALEQAVVDHRLRAGVAFLARLEDQVRDAVEVARLVQVARGRKQHRRVAVVAAAVHAPVVARAVRDVVFLLHRQRIHVGAQADRARPLASLRPGMTATMPVRPMPAWCSMPSAVS